MKKELLEKFDFLNSEPTQEYIDYLIKKVFQKETIEKSLNDYLWPKNRNGIKYEGTYQKFKKWREQLSIAISRKDEESASHICKEVLDWGGIGVAKKNKITIDELITSKQLLKKLESARKIITSEEINLDKIDFPVNSGFSKIYTCLSEKYIIYDSRVAAKMCKLSAELFYDENPLRIGKCAYNAKANRNPGKQFPMLSGNNKKYFESNIKAAWILESISQKHKVLDLDQSELIFAFQTTLFQTGYEI